MRKFIQLIRRLIFRKHYKAVDIRNLLDKFNREASFYPMFKTAHHKNNYDVEIIKETSGRKHYWVSSQYGIHRINKNSLGD